MKTLTHGEQVKMNNWKYQPVVTVGTVEGYAKKYDEDPAEAVEHEREAGGHLAWSMKDAAVLEANYAGKAYAIAKRQEAYDNATVLEYGEHVLIEGREYVVLVNGERYADPIRFSPVN